MPFTADKNPAIEKAIAGHLDIIREEILSEFEPITILLSGSFGRGEGTVIMEGGRVRPLKDYDILVVVKHKFPPERISQIEARILYRIGESRTKSDFRFAGFTVSIDQTTIRRLRLFPDIATYEIKAGSHLIYGQDVRRKISLGPRDIPLSNGLRFLFKKVLGLIFQLEPDIFQNEPVDADRIRYLIYECMKAWVEIGTATSLIGGVYAPSYSQRLDALEATPPPILQECEALRPGLKSRVIAATKEKLRPTGNLYSGRDLSLLWMTARDDLIVTIEKYLESYVGASPGSWLNRYEAYYKLLARYYYSDLARGIIKGAIGFSPSVLTWILSRGYQRHYAWDYARNLKITRGNRSIDPATEVPILRVFTTAPLLALAAHSEGPDEETIATFRSALSTVYPPTDRDAVGWSAWLKAREDLYNAFRLWHGQR